MKNRKTHRKDHVLPLQVLPMLGCLMLLLAVLFIGMYALTFSPEALSGVVIRSVFLLSGTLGVIVAWKFIGTHLVGWHVAPSLFLRRFMVSRHIWKRGLSGKTQKTPL